jgi:hypothetical protein
MARYNFSNFLVRNFDIVTDQDANGLSRMIISGFLSYDEARQYARQLYGQEGTLRELLQTCHSLIVSEQNLSLLGTAFSYADYELFFEQQIAPQEISTDPLLNEPESIIRGEEPEESAAPAVNSGDQPATTEEDDLFNDAPTKQNTGNDIFGEDFW